MFLEIELPFIHPGPGCCLPIRIPSRWTGRCKYLSSWKAFSKPNTTTSFDPYIFIIF